MKTSRSLRVAGLLILATCVASSARGAAVVWLGEDYNRIVDSSGAYVGQFVIPGTSGRFGGMTTVGSEIWVGFLDSSTVLRVDFSGNVLGSLPAFTTESTGGMTTVGNEVWWGSADSNTILRLDLDGSVLGSVSDPDSVRPQPTGGMATVGSEVWWGPAGIDFLGGVLLRYDLAGNWLGSLADPTPGLIVQPLSGGATAGMTTVGDEVWWAAPGLGASDITTDVYRMDFSGNVLGSFCIPSPAGCGPVSVDFGAMTAVPTPTVASSIHPIARYVVLPCLMVGSGLIRLRSRRASGSDAARLPTDGPS